MNIQKAFKHYQAGRRSEAEALYRQILPTKPDHPHALHLPGMVAHETGTNEIAVELIDKAIRVKPSEFLYHNNLGNAPRRAGAERASNQFLNLLQPLKYVKHIRVPPAAFESRQSLLGGP